MGILRALIFVNNPNTKSIFFLYIYIFFDRISVFRYTLSGGETNLWLEPAELAER